MKNQLDTNKTPSIFLINGKVKTTSLAIAELFGKNHKDVLRAIDNLECSDEFCERNFALTQFGVDIPNGGGKRMERCYDITRDGMVFLIMGFTGQNAARFKEAYIAAFNSMESEIESIRYGRKRPVSEAMIDDLRRWLGYEGDISYQQKCKLFPVYRKFCTENRLPQMCFEEFNESIQ